MYGYFTQLEIVHKDFGDFELSPLHLALDF